MQAPAMAVLNFFSITLQEMIDYMVNRLRRSRISAVKPSALIGRLK
jgi:hypothetical protein